MSPATARPRRTARPAAAPESARPADPVEVCFQEYRQSAVRLVERVHDLTVGSAPDPPPGERDFRLVRSVFGKWSMETLVALHALPSAGFEELRRTLPGISPRVLSLKLKGLEEHGMIRREIVDSHPPKVRYTLTEQGWTVAWLSEPVLLYLEQVGRRENGTTAAAHPTARDG